MTSSKRDCVTSQQREAEGATSNYRDEVKEASYSKVAVKYGGNGELCAVGIQLPDMSGIQMVKGSLIVKWSVNQMVV